MPLYEYECAACGQRFEAIQKFADAPLSACKLCGKGPVEKLLSSPAIQFKGEGWYVTDYARKDKGEGAKKDGDQKDGDKKTGGKNTGDAKAGGGESKPESTSAATTKKAERGGTTAPASKD